MVMFQEPAAGHRARLKVWIVALVAALTGCSLPERAPPFEGRLDLSEWRSDKSSGVELRGEWDFFWEDLRAPEALAAADAQERFSVPGFWETHPRLKQMDGTALGFYGRGAYRLRLTLPHDHASAALSISLLGTNSAYELWVIDSTGRGTKLMTNGRLGGANSEGIPQWKPMHVELPPLTNPNIQLILIVDNAHHARGGLWAAPVLHASSRARQDILLQRLGQAASFGIFIMMGVYHLLLFLRRRDDRASLWLGLMLLLTGVYQFTTSHFLAFYIDEPSVRGFHVSLGLWLSGSVVMNAASIEFVRSILPTPWTDTLRTWIWLLTGVCVVFFAGSSVQLLSLAGPYVVSVSGIFSVVILGHRMLKGVVAREESALPLFLGFCALAVSVVNDVLNAEGYLQTGTLVPLGLLFFTISHSWLLARRFATAYETAEHLTTSLQDEVKSQTEFLEVATREAQEASVAAIEAKEEAELLRTAAEAHSESLRVLDRQKTEFFQNMSHELRTPLTLILGPLEESTKRYSQDSDIAVATKNARRLLRLVNQLLDFQKLEAGKKELRLEPLDVNRFTYVLGDYFASACSNKTIGFRVTRDGRALVQDDAVMIQSEPDALEKVAFNFLSNALKYTPRGGCIELGIVLQPGNRVRLFVKDSGPGISEEGQTKLFQVFSQVEESTTREYEGTGLGLALVKSLVEEMGGAVGVESDVGKGSTFFAEFPVIEAVTPKPLKSLLMIEDDEATMRMYERGLKKVEILSDFEQAMDYPSAMRLLSENRYKLVVADGNIPGGDGAELLARVRGDTPDTKLVLLTGDDNQARFQDALSNANIDDILLKPIGLKDLTTRICNVIESYSGVDEERKEFKAREWLLSDGGETGVEVDVEEEGEATLESEGKGQRVLVVDDLEDMRNLIGDALKKRGYRVLKAANGAQGYEVICKRQPDLVISDWMMPKLSGPDMLKKVRANPDVATTPFILLTAKSDEESKLIGTEIGADVFLGKPFNDQELGSVVRNLLGLKSREKEVQKLNDYITESVLKRYLPPALIGDILSGELSMDKPAELRAVTVLFSDLRGFTKTSEELGPEGISAFLNEYLTVMNQVIFEHGGTIDKFIGDAIMVLFGAPQDMSPQEQVRRATDCAKAMQRRMTALTEDWKNDGAGHLQMRIGIHHGSAVVGNFGSAQRSDYTAIGPTVNMASRIESAAEPGEVFVSKTTSSLMMEGTTTEVGAFELKGIEGKATLYKVV